VDGRSIPPDIWDPCGREVDTTRYLRSLWTGGRYHQISEIIVDGRSIPPDIWNHREREIDITSYMCIWNPCGMGGTGRSTCAWYRYILWIVCTLCTLWFHLFEKYKWYDSFVNEQR
jgi:hypothetical protein